MHKLHGPCLPIKNKGILNLRLASNHLKIHGHVTVIYYTFSMRIVGQVKSENIICYFLYDVACTKVLCFLRMIYLRAWKEIDYTLTK